jgi:hypothetical protein
MDPSKSVLDTKSGDDPRGNKISTRERLYPIKSTNNETTQYCQSCHQYQPCHYFINNTMHCKSCIQSCTDEQDSKDPVTEKKRKSVVYSMSN